MSSVSLLYAICKGRAPASFRLKNVIHLKNISFITKKLEHDL
jgi:hypothetical protein